MATTQHAYQISHEDAKPTIALSQLADTNALDLHAISVSQLLGRDYIFIDTYYLKLPASPESQKQLFQQLVKQLGLMESHCVIVSFEEQNGRDLSFMRHDLAWYKHQICRIDANAITQPEQQEFMNMIWQCSSPANGF